MGKPRLPLPVTGRTRADLLTVYPTGRATVAARACSFPTLPRPNWTEALAVSWGASVKTRSLPWRAHRRPSAAPEPSPAGQAAGYKAFISYSHAVDGKLAPALHGALHRFAKPWYRPRALRVFHDQTSLAANPGLWSSIQAALVS